jgi:5-oxopent-3-ene-1,2,5-tricarboxylate decarboxylase/2-hydroxyhepta-2,4-diene-1,7-dioate isomerase
MPVAPFALSGAVYGVLLNHRSALDELGSTMELPPYKGAPQAPVLFVKPRSSLASHGDVVNLPREVPQVAVGACLGLVIGKSACRVSQSRALEHVAGYLIVNDVTVPHDSFFRPSTRQIARDGFCPMSARVIVHAAAIDPDALAIRVSVDNVEQQVASTEDLVRPVAKLLADITDFMTLHPGDVLTVGAASPRPRVRAGQTVRIEIEHLGFLENTFEQEPA